MYNQNANVQSTEQSVEKIFTKNSIFYIQSEKQNSLNSEKENTFMDNFCFILNLFGLIGVTLNIEQKSIFITGCIKLLNIYFSLFTLYFLMLNISSIYTHGEINGEGIMNIIYFFIVTMLRFFFVFKGKRVLNVCRKLMNTKSTSDVYCQLSLKLWMMFYLCIILVITTAVSYKEIIASHSFTLALRNYTYLLGGMYPSTIPLKILVLMLEFTRNFLELMPPVAALMLLCVMYNELCLQILAAKKIITSITLNNRLNTNDIEECISVVYKLSDLVTYVNEEMSLPLFYILSSFIIYTMSIISITAVRPPGFVFSMVFLFITIGIILELFIVGALGSRISELYFEIKSTIMASNAFKVMCTGKSDAVNIIALVHLFNHLTDNFKIITLKTVEVNRKLILNVICSFITYGTILYQMMKM